MDREDIDFEIVLIYIHALDHSLGKPKFMEEFENLPWYTLYGSGKSCVGYSRLTSLEEMRLRKMQVI